MFMNERRETDEVFFKQEPILKHNLRVEILGDPLIRPFCIMLLYRYLLHYGLLLHIMSQYLYLFSLILQGLHKEGECRQLGFWDRKGANIRDLLCTAPKVLKLHGSHFWN